MNSSKIIRVAAILEYDGSQFCGWQWQQGVRTVQDIVEHALSMVADETVRVITAGRTDTGVHACEQVIHFETSAQRSEFSWVRGANSNLPQDVTILWAKEVDEQFHARFSATGRRYRYVILNRPIRPTHLHKLVTWDYRPLQLERMQQAATYLVGTHDFSAYRAVACQAKSPVREMRELQVSRRDDFIIIDAYANAFLHHMIRNIAGVLLAIGAGEREPQWAREVLELRDRTLGGITAPPDGLYLTAVEYPEIHQIPRLSQNCALW